MKFKSIVHKTLQRFGYDLNKYPILPESLVRRRLFFKTMNFDAVFDVGANRGQFGEYLRHQVQFKKKIFSFEPLSSAYAVLNAKAALDQNWVTYNFALGEHEEKKEINIAGNSYSSSFLKMLPVHEKAAPESKFIDKEWVEVKTLDSITDDLTDFNKNIFLKIDTQGFERQVLLGAKNKLQFINTIQLEMSLLPLYNGEPIFEETYAFLNKLGYSLIDIECGFTDPTTGKLLQVDGFFQRKHDL